MCSREAREPLRQGGGPDHPPLRPSCLCPTRLVEGPPVLALSTLVPCTYSARAVLLVDCCQIGTITITHLIEKVYPRALRLRGRSLRDRHIPDSVSKPQSPARQHGLWSGPLMAWVWVAHGMPVQKGPCMVPMQSSIALPWRFSCHRRPDLSP